MILPRGSVKELLRIKRMNQCEVADQIGAHHSVFSRYLNNQKKLPPLQSENLAKLLGISVREVQANRIRENP